MTNQKRAEGSLKCNRCPECNGYGCPGNLPGLGGVFENQNFKLNCDVWKSLYIENRSQIEKIQFSPSDLRCGPVTGAVENIGFAREEDFYLPYLQNAKNAGIGLCVGDGCPDEKLLLGIKAVKMLNTKAAFFLKPYPDERLEERIEWVKPYADFIGIDIDSYNILTMRNLVNLEKKSEVQLEKFRTRTQKPFVIKGVFTMEDIELVKKVRPDVVYISNHGGRVETRIGSSGEFLATYGKELKKYCKQIWVDGGIRCREDVKTAIYFGADKVIAARPFIRGTFDGNFDEIIRDFI